MANESSITFATTDVLPDDKKNGTIWFVTKDGKTDNIYLDYNNNRYPLNIPIDYIKSGDPGLMTQHTRNILSWLHVDKSQTEDSITFHIQGTEAEYVDDDKVPVTDLRAALGTIFGVPKDSLGEETFIYNAGEIQSLGGETNGNN